MNQEQIRAIVELEAGVLGGIILRNELLAEIPLVEVDDFYDPRHRFVFEAMRNLEAESRPIDVVTLQHRMVERGIKAVDFAFLGELALRVPVVENVHDYVKQIRSASMGRKVRVALSEVLEKGNQLEIDGAELLSMAMAKLSSIGDMSPDETRGIREVVKSRFDQLGQIAAERASGERSMTGFPTGMAGLDEKLGGWQPGIVSIVAARPGMGKAQPLDAKVLTPVGWRTMGELSVGDEVVGSDGAPVRIVAVHERGELDVFRVEFADGGSTECCGDHLWTTRTRSDRRRGVSASPKRTEDIARTLFRAGGGRNHSVQYVKPVSLKSDMGVTLDPYLLGLYLGDGHSAGCVYFTNPEPDLRAAFIERLPAGCVGVAVDDLQLRVKSRELSRTDEGWPARSDLRRLLGEMGLDGLRSHEKFVPAQYLFGAVEARLAVLRGLLDTDGYVTGDRIIEFSTTSPRLRDDVMFIVGSLGGLASCAEHQGSYTKDGERHAAKTAWRILIRFPTGEVTPVSSRKHLERWAGGPQRCPERFISNVVPAGRKACRCITVSADDGLYVTDDFLVTHNSSLGLATADASSAAGFGVHLFSLEDTEEAYADRTIARTSGVPAEALRNAKLERGHASDISRAMAGLKSRRWLVDGRSGLTADEIVRSARRHRKANGTCVVIVDYIQLIKRANPRQSPHEALTEIITTLADAAKQDRIAYVVMSQLNRGVEQRQDKRPLLSDLRESGSLEERCKCAVGLYRGSYYGEPIKGIDWDPDWKGRAWKPSDEEFKAQIQAIVMKNSNGRTGTVWGEWHGPTTRVS